MSTTVARIGRSLLAAAVALVGLASTAGPAPGAEPGDFINLTVEYPPFEKCKAHSLVVFVSHHKAIETGDFNAHYASGYVDKKLRQATKPTKATARLPIPKGGRPIIYFSYKWTTPSGLEGYGIEDVGYEAKPGASLYLRFKNYGHPDDLTGEKNHITFASSAYTFSELDKRLKSVEVKEQLVRAELDSPQVKREEYTVKHTLSIQEGWKGEAELKKELKGRWPVVEAGISTSVKAAIERATSKTVETARTSTREVTIPANGKQYVMVWVETYRTGKAITYVDGKRYEAPFEFREGWDLQTKLAKD